MISKSLGTIDSVRLVSRNSELSCRVMQHSCTCICTWKTEYEQHDECNSIMRHSKSLLSKSLVEFQKSSFPQLLIVYIPQRRDYALPK